MTVYAVASIEWLGDKDRGPSGSVRGSVLIRRDRCWSAELEWADDGAWLTLLSPVAPPITREADVPFFLDAKKPAAKLRVIPR